MATTASHREMASYSQHIKAVRRINTPSGEFCQLSLDTLTALTVPARQRQHRGLKFGKVQRIRQQGLVRCSLHILHHGTVWGMEWSMQQLCSDFCKTETTQRQAALLQKYLLVYWTWRARLTDMLADQIRLTRRQQRPHHQNQATSSLTFRSQTLPQPLGMCRICMRYQTQQTVACSQAAGHATLR